MPPGCLPPNSTARWSLIAVKEKWAQGGGLQPVVVGMDHLPAESEIRHTISNLLSMKLMTGIAFNAYERRLAFRVYIYLTPAYS